MKILPDYLIQMMPEFEEAIEELRLSIIDHAYDLIKCLDINELSSDDIRRKLESFNLKIEDMAESWLPNGRFYQLYPLIKYNRTRLNSLKSIVKSGGQFEGLWSNDFNTKPEYNYKSIQTLRHYDLKSSYDGYFYVSGDTKRAPDGKVTSSVLTALSTDILINQAMPAGYTYLYIPWPKPVYPTDTGHEYNVHMLMFDRLYHNYSIHDPNYYSNLYPESCNYDSDSIGKTPFWIDYHYMNNQYVDENKYIDPNTGRYTRNALLNDSNAVFPTTYYLHSISKSTFASEDQPLTFINHQNILDTVSARDDGYTHRFDVLSVPAIKSVSLANHIKEFKPIWNSSPIINSSFQSSTVNVYNNKLSMYNLFKIKKEFTETICDNIYKANDTNDIVKLNNPSISEISHTNHDDLALGHLDKLFVGYTQENIADRGQNKSITSTCNLYSNTDISAITFDPTLNYTIFTVGKLDSGDQINVPSDKVIIKGNPVTHELTLHTTESIQSNYITYKVSPNYKLWFSSDKSNATISSNVEIELYNTLGVRGIFDFSSNEVSFKFKINGIYDKLGKQIKDDTAKINCILINNEYRLVFSSLSNINYEAAYIIFNTEILSGSVPDLTPSEIDVFNLTTGTVQLGLYRAQSNLFSVDDGITWITLDDLYALNYIIVDEEINMFYGREPITVYHDDGEM